jgi:magnesium transporter
MITLAYKKNDEIRTTSDLEEILKIPKEDFVWLDVLDATDEEKEKIKNTFGIKLILLKKRRIRHSFRFIENENNIIINTRLLHTDKKTLYSKPISFTIEDDYLVSYHNIDHLSYSDVYTELDHTDISNANGRLVFLRILGKILEYDIDIIEKITGNIVKLSKKVTLKEDLREDLIYDITDLQEQLILVRRNIIDKHRVVLSVSKNDDFSKKHLQKLITVIEKDINSILDYISFDFERLEYIQNTLMGLINLRQNLIMKIFTIVSVIFLPPTLIASIYGMNFQNMPELNFPYAYPISLSIIISLSILALYYFKRKKWI